MGPITLTTLAAAAFVLGRGCDVGKPADERRLPEATQRGGPSLWSSLASRRSVRVFGQRALSEAEVGQLLWAAQGRVDGHRTAPSAGALYPLAVRVVDARGVWRYVPSDHALVLEVAADRRSALGAATFGQEAVERAPVTFVITGDLRITAKKYGARAERFVALEAGHVAQNILLAATALDLAAVPVGAFDDAAVRRQLSLPAEITPIYLLPVGSK
jgi:SagB-type dehydrogenase family enzyme